MFEKSNGCTMFLLLCVPCKILVKFFVSSFRTCLWGQGCFVKVMAVIYYYLFLFTSTEWSQVILGSGNNLHDVSKQFQENEIIFKMQSKVWQHKMLNLFIKRSLLVLCGFWYDGKSMQCFGSASSFTGFMYKRSWRDSC